MSSTIAIRLDALAIAWVTLERVSVKEGSRDRLSAGATHDVDIRIAGSVDGLPFEQSIAALLTIGHDQVKATSATPDQAQLLAYLLSKLNGTTREKLLRELPEQFAEAGDRLPDVDSVLVEAAAVMLKRLRGKKSIQARGPVRCEYRLRDGHPQPPPSVTERLAPSGNRRLRVAG